MAETERVAGFLSSVGLDVAAYSGRTENREEFEDRLRDNQIKALVATSALGMGYDKPDLAFCIHLGSPASPVAYYQQVGRAGRALDDALAVLVPAESDEGIWNYFATAGIPDEAQVEQILDLLRDAPRSIPSLESATGIRRTRLEGLLKILAVDGAAERLPEGWIGTGQPWYFDQAKWSALRRVRAAEADLMRRYASGSGCLMEFLQLALDDPEPHPCGRCSVCTGRCRARAPEPSRARWRRHDDSSVGSTWSSRPRKQWASGLPDRKGKITFLESGRALAFADDPAWNADLARLWQSDEPAPPELLAGIVEVLRRWSGHGNGRSRWCRCRPAAIRNSYGRWPRTSLRSVGCRSSTPWRSAGRRPSRTRLPRRGPRICSTAPDWSRASRSTGRCCWLTTPYGPAGR